MPFSSSFTSSFRARRRSAAALFFAALMSCAMLAVESASPTLAAKASHAGWPVCMRYGHYECAGKSFRNTSNSNATFHGDPNEPNELLGGNGDDTLYAGNAGDVIWGDYEPSGQPESQRDFLHGGAGNDFIYASHGYNEIWTGAGNDQIALVYGHGTVYCNGSGLKTFVMRYLPANRHYTLVGCDHKKILPYRA
jgi:hypothetical protein